MGYTQTLISMEQMDVDKLELNLFKQLNHSFMFNIKIRTERFHWLQHLNQRIFLKHFDSIKWQSNEERAEYLQNYKYLYECCICMSTKNSNFQLNFGRES